MQDFQPDQLLVYPPVGLVRFCDLSQGPAAYGGGLFLRLKPQIGRLTSDVLIPVATAEKNGLRALSTKAELREALGILRQKKQTVFRILLKGPFCKETWQLRLTSAALADQARLLRDFYREPGEPKLTVPEKGLFDEALARLSAEMGAIGGISPATAQQRLLFILAQPRTRPAPENERPDQLGQSKRVGHSMATAESVHHPYPIRHGDIRLMQNSFRK